MFSFRDARRQSSRFNQKSRFQDALHRCSLRVISGRKERKEKKKKEEEKATTDVDTPRRDVPRRVFPRDTSFDIFFCVCFSVSRLRRSFFFFFVSAAFQLMTAKGFYSTRSNTMRGKRMKTGDVFFGRETKMGYE